MTNPKKIYLRKKENRFIFETKIKGKTTSLITLPTNYEKFLMEMCRLVKGLCPDCKTLVKSSFFDVEKWEKIQQNLESADFKSDNVNKHPKKVPTININGIQEIDDLDEEINEVLSRVHV